MGPLRRVKLTELNAHLVCVLCSGYFVDATTIIECLHTFCKTCIVRYLQTSSFCPICDVQVHKTKPLLSLREDRTLQDVVFKLVPGLFHSEMNRRLNFYTEHPEAGGDKTEQSLRERRHFFHVDDQISLSLEYLPTIPSSSYSHLHGLKPLKINNGQQGRAKTVEDDKEGGIKEEVKKEEAKEEQEKMSGKVIHKRYLRCPAAVQVSHLEKFIRLKFSLTPQTHRVDIMHGGDCLVGELTLLDVVYMYKWTEDAPLRLMYTVTAIPQSRKRPRPSSLRTPASTDSEAPDPKIPKTQPSLIHQQPSLQHTLSSVHPVLGRDQDAMETGILEGSGSVTDVKGMPEEEKPANESNASSSIANGSPAIGVVSVPVSVNIPSLPNTILNNGIGQLPTTLPTGRRTAFTKTTPATATPRLAVPNKPFAAADSVAPLITTREGVVPAVTTLPTTVTSTICVSSSNIINTPITSVLTTPPLPVVSGPRMPINGIIEPCMKNINSSGNQPPILQPIIPTKPRLGRPPNASRVAAASMKAGVRVGDQRAPRPVTSGKMLNKVHTAMNRTNPIVSTSLNVQSRLSTINGPKPGTAKVSVKRPNEVPNVCASSGIENTSAKINSALQNHTHAGSQFLPNTSVSSGSAQSQSTMVAQPMTPSVTSQVSVVPTNQKSPNLSSQTRAVSGDIQSPSLVPTKNIEAAQHTSSPQVTQKPSDILNQRGLQVSQKPTSVANARHGFGTAVRPTFTNPTGVAPQRATVQALQSANSQVSQNLSSVSVACTKTSTALCPSTNGSPQTMMPSTTVPGNTASSASNAKSADGKQLSVAGSSQQVLTNSAPQRSAQTSVSRKAPLSSAVSQGTPTTSVSRLSTGSAPNKVHTTTAAHKTPASPAPHRAPPSPAPHRAPPSPAPHRTPVNQSSNRANQTPAPHRTLQSPAPHRAPPSPSPHRPPSSPAPHRAPPSPAPHRAPPSPAPHRAPPSPAPHRAPPSPAPHRAPPSPAPHRAPPSPAPHRAPPSPAPHRAPPSPSPHRAPPSPAPHRAPPSPAPHRASPGPAANRASPSPAPHRASPNFVSQRTSPNTTPNQTPASPAGQAPASPAGHAPASPAFQAPASPAFQAPASPAAFQSPASPAVQASASSAVQDTLHNFGQQLSQSISVSKSSANPVMGQDQTSGAKASGGSTTSTGSVMTSTKEVSVSSSNPATALGTNGIGNKAGVTKFSQNVSQGGNSSPNTNSNVAPTKPSTSMKAPKSPGRKRTSGGTSPTILSIAQSLANRQLQRTINSTQVPSTISTNTTTTAPVTSHQPYPATSNTAVYPSPVCSALVSPALAAAAYMATAYGGDASAALTDVTAMRNLITLSQTAACIRELNLAAMVQAAEAIPRPSDPAPIDLSPTSKAAPQSPLTNGRGNMTTTSPVTTNTKSSQGKSGSPKTSVSNADSAPTISPPTPEVTITKLPSTPATSASTNPASTSGKNVPALVKLTTSSTNTVSITKRPVSSNRIAVTKSPANASVRQIPNPSFLRHQSEVRNNNNVVSKSATVSSSSSTVTTSTASIKSQPSSKLTNNNRATGNSPLKDTGPLPETSSILKIEHLTRSLAAPAAAAAASASSAPSFRFFDKR